MTHFIGSQANSVTPCPDHQSNSPFIVPIRGQDKSPPIFCVHPSGGDVQIYGKMARTLAKRYPLVGIQSRLLTGSREEFSSIDAMATRYAQEIICRQSDGHVRLLGFSFGGFVATKITERLLAAGRKVSFLGLIDSDLRWTNGDDFSRQQLTLRLVQLSVRFQNVGLMNVMPLDELHRHMSQCVNRYFEMKRFSISDLMQDLDDRGLINGQFPREIEKLGSFISIFMVHCQLLRQFRATPIQVPLHLWWPTDSQSAVDRRGQPWEEFAQQGITEYFLQGTHYSVMQNPTVRTVAQQVATAVENSVNSSH